MAAKKTAKSNKPAPKFKTLSDAYLQASKGDALAQRCIIGTLSNLGCDHLAPEGPAGKYGKPPVEAKWVRYWRGLTRYLESLVAEYGETEADASRELVAELNAAVGYSDIVDIT